MKTTFGVNEVLKNPQMMNKESNWLFSEFYSSEEDLKKMSIKNLKKVQTIVCLGLIDENKSTVTFKEQKDKGIEGFYSLIEIKTLRENSPLIILRSYNGPTMGEPKFSLIFPNYNKFGNNITLSMKTNTISYSSWSVFCNQVHSYPKVKSFIIERTSFSYFLDRDSEELSSEEKRNFSLMLQQQCLR